MRKDGFVRFSLLFACVTSIVWHVNSHRYGLHVFANTAILSLICSASSALLSLSALSKLILSVKRKTLTGIKRLLSKHYDIVCFFGPRILGNVARYDVTTFLFREFDCIK